MKSYSVNQSKTHGLEVWILTTFEDGDYCDERTFWSKEQATTEGMRWVNEK